ncbi:MAG: hypothetical protein AAGE88_20420 [Actinomycetota bacterium]
MTDSSSYVLKRQRCQCTPIALLAIALSITGCGLIGTDGEDASPSSEETALDPTTAAPVGAEDEPSDPVPGSEGGAPCASTEASTVGTVASPALTETSGLAASARHPGG